MATMARRGRPPLPWRNKIVGFNLHPNVDALIGTLAAEAGTDRSRWLTLVVAEKSGVPIESLLVPDDNQEVLQKPA